MDVPALGQLPQIIGRIHAQIMPLGLNGTHRYFFIAKVKQRSAWTLLISSISRLSSSSVITLRN